VTVFTVAVRKTIDSLVLVLSACLPAVRCLRAACCNVSGPERTAEADASASSSACCVTPALGTKRFSPDLCRRNPGAGSGVKVEIELVKTAEPARYQSLGFVSATRVIENQVEASEECVYHTCSPEKSQRYPTPQQITML
jgi:hypothetical protein